MGLRAFHLLFIGASVVLAAFVAAWAAQQYQTMHGVTYAVTVIAALTSGAGLAFYGAAFQKKTRRLS
jgi:hypothetical protein